MLACEYTFAVFFNRQSKRLVACTSEISLPRSRSVSRNLDTKSGCEGDYSEIVSSILSLRTHRTNVKRVSPQYDSYYYLLIIAVSLLSTY